MPCDGYSVIIVVIEMVVINNGEDALQPIAMHCYATKGLKIPPDFPAGVPYAAIPLPPVFLKVHVLEGSRWTTREQEEMMTLDYCSLLCIVDG